MNEIDEWGKCRLRARLYFQNFSEKIFVHSKSWKRRLGEYASVCILVECVYKSDGDDEFYLWTLRNAVSLALPDPDGVVVTIDT